jgi:hypothetical protein
VQPHKDVLLQGSPRFFFSKKGAESLAPK